jgi:hypothetical protein
MTVPKLQQTCLFFQLPQTGITPTLRVHLRTFLLNHKHKLQHDYDYTTLYPNRDPIVQIRQPRQASQGSQAYSHWNGIGNQNTIPQATSIHADALTQGWPCQKQHKNVKRPSRRVMGAVLQYGVSLGSLCMPDVADTKRGGTICPNKASCELHSHRS